MYTRLQELRKHGQEDKSPAIPLTGADLRIALRMFVHTFGDKYLLAHSDLGRHSFYYMPDLQPWEWAIALQIAVDIAADCESEDERVLRLKQHFRELLGSCKHETTVRIRGIPFVIERPPVPF